MAVRVRQLVGMSGSTGVFIKGDEHDVDEAEALRLQAANIVEVIELPKFAGRVSKSRKADVDDGIRAAEGSEGGKAAGAAEGEDGPG